MNIAFIGYGAVAAVHARGLASIPEVTFAAVSGPDRRGVELFASSYGVRKICASVEEAVTNADLAVVCSPSPLHYMQSRACLSAGVHVLVELPPCARVEEAAQLEAVAAENKVRIWCAHTSRYLTPYRRITSYLQQGELGSIEQVVYIRHLVPRVRSWTDDALHHHCAHPLDLLLHWFEEIVPTGCVMRPADANPESVALLATLPGGAAASIAVTYASRQPMSLLRVVGSRHTVDTDGFSYIDSDLTDIRLRVNESETYERAIREQDAEVVRACREGGGGVTWKETMLLLRCVNSFQEMGRREQFSLRTCD